MCILNVRSTARMAERAGRGMFWGVFDAVWGVRMVVWWWVLVLVCVCVCARVTDGDVCVMTSTDAVAARRARARALG